ncbi:uncharacterized protein KY384_007590 [Bacidia gigantensis]|uniref:uncharacterized protein n=1 Tax=Bacidia gigantensis TaxID=2732470 RepID=UPI001D047C96|nr:uncharacterized protein KY384_007590 [Bacidia gigantensis]KAG8527438.1 hypothetical protein KY384_007590 [Bacidia gigantensis]
MAALQAYPDISKSTGAGPGQFDLIVLDPPWPNRSVRRSGKYRETNPFDGPFNSLTTSLGRHIAPGGLVACWNTNKESVGNETLNLFAAWGLELIEEWAWLKVTINGQPVIDLSGFWRKPYELLLIGRRPLEAGHETRQGLRENNNVVKRVVAAVPDLHSRKPNLKGVLRQTLLENVSEYRALEIFARNLTADWWAWGDETLKYNNSHAWSQTSQDGSFNRFKTTDDDIH